MVWDTPKHVGEIWWVMYRGADKSLAPPDWKRQLKVHHFSSDEEVTLLPRRPGWTDKHSELFLSGLQKLEFGRCSLFPSWSGQGLISTSVLNEKFLIEGVYSPWARQLWCDVPANSVFLFDKPAVRIMRISRQPFPVKIMIDQKQLENMEYLNTGLFISPSDISELDCATTKTDTAERSMSIGRESLQVFFCTRGLGVLPGSTARG